MQIDIKPQTNLNITTSQSIKQSSKHLFVAKDVFTMPLPSTSNTPDDIAKQFWTKAVEIKQKLNEQHVDITPQVQSKAPSTQQNTSNCNCSSFKKKLFIHFTSATSSKY